MLTLSRKPGQKIQIGDAIVEVVSCSARRVRIGITAPAEVLVRRCELPLEKADPGCIVAVKGGANVDA